MLKKPHPKRRSMPLPVGKMRVRNLLRERLAALGLNQGEVARIVGRNRVQVCQLVNEDNPNPKLRFVLLLAAALGTTVEDLFQLEVPAPASSTGPGRGST